MSIAAGRPKADASKYEFKTKVSRYDQVSAMLWAATACIGAICLVLFLIWLTTIVRIRPAQAVVEWNDDLAGNNNNPEGIAEDFLEPGVEELADVPEPQLADAIEAVTDAVSTQKAHLEAVEGNAELMGTGRGLGDHREPGPGNGGNRRDKPWERWEIRYSTVSPEEYGAQLDFFGIELGAISRGTAQILYLSGLSQPSPRQRAGTKSLEKRIFFNYRQGRLLAWDRQFFEEAGVDLGSGNSEYILVQFYPNPARTDLLRKERAAIGNRSVEEVKRTIFGVRAGGSGYEYYVIDVQYKI